MVKLIISTPAKVANARIIVAQMDRRATITHRIAGMVVLTSLLLEDGNLQKASEEGFDGTAKGKDTVIVDSTVIAVEEVVVVPRMVHVDNFVLGNTHVVEAPLPFAQVTLTVTIQATKASNLHVDGGAAEAITIIVTVVNMHLHLLLRFYKRNGSV